MGHTQEISAGSVHRIQFYAHFWGNNLMKRKQQSSIKRIGVGERNQSIISVM